MFWFRLYRCQSIICLYSTFFLYILILSGPSADIILRDLFSGLAAGDFSLVRTLLSLSFCCAGRSLVAERRGAGRRTGFEAPRTDFLGKRGQALRTIYNIVHCSNIYVFQRLVCATIVAS